MAVGAGIMTNPNVHVAHALLKNHAHVAQPPPCKVPRHPLQSVITTSFTVDLTQAIDPRPWIDGLRISSRTRLLQ